MQQSGIHVMVREEVTEHFAVKDNDLVAAELLEIARKKEEGEVCYIMQRSRYEYNH